MGAVNHKSKLVQTMAWHREDIKPLHESVMIQANGAYMGEYQIVVHFDVPHPIHVIISGYYDH